MIDVKRIFIVALTLLLANFANAASIIKCESIKSQVQLSDGKGLQLPLPDKSDCNFSFNVVENIDGKNNFGIFVGPSRNNFGANAQNDIYIKSSANGHLELAGSIPVGAEETLKGKYKYINQEGGARYLSFYSIKKTIVTSKSTKALLIDGKYCIDRNILRNISDNPAKPCKMKINATFKTPICLRLFGDAAKTVALNYCSELLK